jgi:hypothetical protein
MGFFGFFAIGVKFEVGLELGDCFVFLFHLLRDLCEGVVSGGVVGLGFDGILRSEVGALQVVVAHVELGDSEIFVDTLVVGLNTRYFREFAMDGTAFGARFGHVGVGDVGVCAGGTATTAITATTTATAGVVSGESGSGCAWEGMIGCGGGGRGGGTWGVGWRGCGFCGSAWERELFGS